MLINRFALALLFLTASLLTSPVIHACCPDDGNGAPAPSSRGLGEAFPAATDLAQDAAWSVYAFEQDGLRYLQVNDAQGKVRAAVGRIGDLLWAMPMGSDSARVSVSGLAPNGSSTQVVYRSSDVEVIRVVTPAGDAWTIHALGSDR